ncbi:hypothetical protein F4804DRAFT_319998 [Jackrogersella minutella]|nr:hypothetical protein F4804DRAFT_319998 [Jackrogersella minutella]
MPSLNQLNALLAMPASLRLALIGAPSRIRPSSVCVSSKGLRHYAASKYPNIAAFSIPEFRITPPTALSPEELYETSSMPSTYDDPLEDKLMTLFTKNPPTFQYGESDFYMLKKNTRVPEVCVLGRSNVGKSSFVNALAGRHKGLLAYVSTKAGKTRAINTYGFGPPPLPKDIAAQAAEYKGKEDIPTHAFYLVDMPGYGFASMQSWGRNITLYLTKRVGVKGAIVLIDAEVGPKKTDIQLLELLSSVGMRTAIVLTKADKVKGGLEGLRSTCNKLWDEILAIEKKSNDDWPWEKDIFVTAVGANDYAVASSTVTTARLAVARLAGLATDDRPKPARNQKWTGKIISFDDLQYAPSKGVPITPEETRVGYTPFEAQATLENYAASKQVSSPFAHLERASREPDRGFPRYRSKTFLGYVGGKGAKRLHAHAFHASTRWAKRQQAARPPAPDFDELRDVLDDFITALKPSQTRVDHLRRASMRHDKAQLPQPKVKTPEKIAYREAYLQKKNPQLTSKVQEVRNKRLEITEQQAQTKQSNQKQSGEKQSGGKRSRVSQQDQRKQRIEDIDAEWPAEAPAHSTKGKGSNDSYLSSDAFKSLVTGTAEMSEPQVPVKKSRTKKKQEKRADKKAGKSNASRKTKGKEELDPFVAKFASVVR